MARPRHGSNHEGEGEGVRGGRGERARPGVYSQKLRDIGVSAIDLPAPGAYGILGESWADRIIRTVCHQPRISSRLSRIPVRPDFKSVNKVER